MSLLKVIGQGLQLVGVFTGQVWLTAAGTALATADAYNEQRKAKRRAISEYNASLKDRLEMVDITPDQPRTIAMGRVRAVEGVRRRWVSGADDRKLTMIVSLAGHEIDAIEQVYFDDVAVTLDGSGYVTTAPYFKGRTESTSSDTVTLDGSGAGVIALSHTPISGTVTAQWSTGEGDGQVQGALIIVSLVGTTLTVSGGTPGATAYASFNYATGTYTARVRSYLGTSTQNIGADLAAEYPGKITADDKFAGIACLVVDIDYDPDVYPQGRPNVTAVFRGAKVYDPRLDSTAGGSGSQRIATPSTWTWSNNSALCAYHFARHANGWAVPAAEIMPAADIADEADFCDTATAFTLRKPDDTTEEVVYQRHTCDIVISTAGDPRGAMDEILESMAGRSGWAGGVWKFRAGRMPASVFAMDQSWLAKRLQEDGTVESGPTLQFTNGVPREAKVNRITGSCVDADQRYQVLPFPAIEDPVLIAAEGATYPLEVEYQAVSHIAHAQHLASIAIRRNQAALKVLAQCNLWAYRLELFDVGTLTLPRYAITDKTMEVIGWRWHPTEGVQLSLAEITDAIYSVQAELSGRDPAPNTALPSPWDVETLEGLSVTSGVTALADGSVVSRARVAWDGAGSESVRNGGRTEIQFRQITDSEWQSWPEDGATTSAIIPALRQGVYYVFRGRFQSAPPLRVRGDWSESVVHKVAAIERDALLAALTAALASAAAAQATADGKIDSFYQTTAPSSASEGDLWFDTDDGYKQYRYTSGAWVTAADTRIGDALNDAADAQATADGKVTTFLATSSPTADAVGDLWLDTDDGNKLYRWSGSAWVALALGTGAIAPSAATELSSDRSASLSYSFVSTTGGFEYRVERLLQISWTNTTAANVQVELSGEIGGGKSSGPGSVWLGIDSQASTALTSNIFSSLTAGTLHTDATSAVRRYTMSDHLTVAPAATIYLALTVYIFSAVGTTTAYAGDGRIRIVAIKR